MCVAAPTKGEPMNLQCPHCQRTIGIPESLAGRTVGCPLCKQSFTAPMVSPITATPPTLPISEVAEPAMLADDTRHLEWQATPMFLCVIVACCYLLSFVLLFLPWQRVLAPSMLNAAGKTPAAPMRDVVLVVGCPASLNERTPSGDLKLEAVKKAATDFVDKLPEQMRLALVMYGHKRENVCGVELVRKLDKIDGGARSELKKRIAGINPVGLAPMAEALRMAGEELAKNQAGGGIVLIADCVDTCDGDALAQVASLNKRIQLTHGANILGFGVIPKDLRALRYIAQAGKGTFVDCQTVAELDAAAASFLKETRQTVEQDVITSSLANTNQSGLSMAFGADPVPASMLMVLYFLCTAAGLLGAIGLTVLTVRVDSPGSQLKPWLILGVLVLSGLGFLVLGLQMILGFPIETDFQRYVFTYRSVWLLLALLTNLLAAVAATALFALQRRPAGRLPKVRVEW